MPTTSIQDNGGEKGDIIATLNYITPTSKVNRRYVAPNAEINTGVYEAKTVIIKDARKGTDQFTLDTSGFTLVNNKTKVPNGAVIEG